MLKDARVHATIPAQDLDRARKFYSEKLGLEPSRENPRGLFYDMGENSRFFLFASEGAASGAHTQMGFSVADIEAEVTDLKRRGVPFEEYEGMDQANSIATFGPIRSAWFKDSEGNLMGMVQFPTE
jgi:catechol 2,3-dioxygenase-like lactoylglutathione lyase family enzyme